MSSNPGVAGRCNRAGNPTEDKSPAGPIVGAVRHDPPRRLRKWLAPAAAFAALATGASLVVSAVANAAGTGPSPSDQGALVAEDHFDTDVTSGWGAAEVGGDYALNTQGAVAKVGLGSGQALSIPPGRMFAASLPETASLNTRNQVTFQLGAIPSSGGGIYAQVALRQQSNGDRYLATAHVLPGGAIKVSLSRLTTAGQVTLAGEKSISSSLTDSGTTLTVVFDATGTSPTSLALSAYLGSATKSAWDVTADDNTDPIAIAGAVGLSAYVSGSSTSTSVFVRNHIAWALAGSSASTTAAPTTTAPATTAPTTTAPTTTAPATTAPTTSGSAGSAPLGSTAYPVPSNAIWVSTSGSDSATGTQSAPYRTVTKAVAAAKTGATLVLMAGTYHESVVIPSNKSLTLQSAPNSAVWLDGSSRITDWTQSGNAWVTTGWTAEFDSTPSYTAVVPSGPNWGFVNTTTYPMAAHPDQVWVNGVAMKQVASLSQVSAGTFYSDYSGNRIYLGSNPSGAEVRASDLGVALGVRSANSVIRGIGVRRYATAVRDMGAIQLQGVGVTMENVIVSDVATTGVTAIATNITVRNSTLTRNGMLGMHGNYADNLKIQNLLVTNNNTEHFNQSPVSGGIKISRTRGISVSNSVFSGNLGTGLWLDESSYNMTVVNNEITDNSGHGLFIEISSLATVANNDITGNDDSGVKINNTDRVKLWNNTIGANVVNLELVQDTRDYSNQGTAGHDPRQAFPDPTMTWKLTTISVTNNVVARGTTSTSVIARDYSTTRSAVAMGIKFSGNLFGRNSGDTLVVWSATATTISKLLSVADIAAAGGGSGNSEIVGTATGLTAGPASYAQALPADIAALTGQPAGTKTVGSFL